MGAVPQHDIAQVLGGIGAVYAAVKALLAQPGNISRVVDMGMGEQHRINSCRRNGKGLPVPEPVLFQALE